MSQARILEALTVSPQTSTPDVPSGRPSRLLVGAQYSAPVQHQYSAPGGCPSTARQVGAQYSVPGGAKQQRQAVHLSAFAAETSLPPVPKRAWWMEEVGGQWTEELNCRCMEELGCLWMLSDWPMVKLGGWWIEKLGRWTEKPGSRWVEKLGGRWMEQLSA